MTEVAGIAFVMTAAMKAALRERGYSDVSIAEMTPGDAHKILGNGADPAPMAIIAEITVFTKNAGPLTKHIELIDGKIANDTSQCGMASGRARRVRIDINHIATLAEIINKMSPREAYSAARIKEGHPDRVKVVLARKLAAFKGDPNVIARTKEFFGYPHGEPAICLHDTDLKGMSESAKSRVGGRDIWPVLCDVVPLLATAARVVRPSTSFGLSNRLTGETYLGSGGLHGAVVVADGSDIKRYLDDFHDRLWLAGLGWFMISDCGAFLERSLVDKAVASPERLIFEAPPVIVLPLVQEPRLAVAYEGAALDTLIACPPLTEAERIEVNRLKKAERARLEPESKAKRAQWSEVHVKRIIATGMPEPWARAQVDRWLDKNELSGLFPLPFDNPKLAGTTVADVLADPDRFLDETLADPFEGLTYGAGKARIYKRENGSLFINSFAHGGATYELKAAPRPDEDAEIERLVRLSPLDYGRARAEAAKRLGVNVPDLNKAVEAKRRAGQKTSVIDADAILDELNADNSVVMIGARTRVLRFEHTPHVASGERYVHRLPTFVRFDDFRNFYLNRLIFTPTGPVSIGQWWLEHPNHKHYRGVIFLPGGPPVVEDRLNLWTGWGVNPKQGKWERTKAHIFEVLAARDDAVNDYTHNWMADAVQHPDRQAEVALVYLGGQGTGRGVIGRALCRIFGQHGRHISSPDHLTGKFNAHLQMCCFLFADEAVAPQDHKAAGALKRLITEPTLHIEPKGVDPYEVPNFLHIMEASNNKWVISASEKERRYVAQVVANAHQQDEAWFKPIYEELSNGGLEAMLFDLLHHDLGDWHPRQIVSTAALGRQMDESLSPFDQWWRELLLTGVLTGARGMPNTAISNTFEEEIEEEEIEESPLYGARTRKRKRKVMRSGLFDQARRISPKLRSESDTALGRFLGDQGCTHTNPLRNKRGWWFPPLSDCRDKWVERFPQTDWAGGPANWTFGDDDESASRAGESATGRPFATGSPETCRQRTR